VIKDKMESETYKLNSKELLVLVRYKHAKGDQKIPSAVSDLRVRWNDTKNRPLLHVAPTILTTKTRRTMMTRRVGRWAQLD